MNQSRFYRQRAETERKAAGTALPNIRAMLLDAAITWDRMAEQAEFIEAMRQSNTLRKVADLIEVQALPRRRTGRVSRIVRRS